MTTYQENPELGTPPYSLAESDLTGSLRSNLLDDDFPHQTKTTIKTAKKC